MTYYYKILFLSFIIPFIFSFHYKINFHKNFKIILISIPLSSIFYIIWDIIFTEMGIWGFNKDYVSAYIINLPVEEYLFFFIIPFCCLYTYHVINKYKAYLIKKINWTKFQFLLISILSVILVFNLSKIYTLVCFLSCILMILISNKLKINYSKSSFHNTFILITIPFLLVNGALTGSFYNQTVVWYNNDMILGLRVFTIPIEDFVYSYQLQLLNLLIYSKIKKYK